MLTMVLAESITEDDDPQLGYLVTSKSRFKTGDIRSRGSS